MRRNGRRPTLILTGTTFVRAVVPPSLASLVATGAVVAVVILGAAAPPARGDRVGADPGVGARVARGIGWA